MAKGIPDAVDDVDLLIANLPYIDAETRTDYRGDERVTVGLAP